MATNTPNSLTRILLVGNRLVGKSTLSKSITGKESGETDLSGSSILISKSSLLLQSPNKQNENIQLIDTPGINLLFSQDKSESLTREVIALGEFDSILFVVDAKNIRRSLALYFQLTIIGKPIIIALNMVDEAESMGLKIDGGELSHLLGIPVVVTVAVKGIGIDNLRNNLLKPKISPIYPFEGSTSPLKKLISSYDSLSNHEISISYLSMAGVNEATQILKKSSPALFEIVQRYEKEVAKKNPFQRMDTFLTDRSFTESEKIKREVLWEFEKEKGILYKLGRWSMRPLTGVPIAIFMLVLMYFWVGRFGATWLVDFLDKQFFARFIIPWASSVFNLIPWPFVRDAFMDPDFGIVTTGLFLAVGIVLPVLFTYYLFVGFLEDIGYFPRLSVLLDKMMRPIGLNGKGVMPLLMGFSCITMAIVTTRMLKTRKERIISTLILILGVPCAPLLSTMFIILGKLHWSATLVIFGIIFSQIIIAGLLANIFLKGELPEFILEISPFRAPKPWLVLKKSFSRTWIFLKEALPLFVLASFLLFLAARGGLLIWIENVTQPLVTQFWGLPKESVQVIIKTIIRRENGVAELARIRSLFTGTQAIVIMLLMTFLLPCVNATLMMFKERGVKIALAIIGTVFIYATLVAGLVNFIFKISGVVY
jgi:ferrous iron transport protein B